MSSWHPTVAKQISNLPTEAFRDSKSGLLHGHGDFVPLLLSILTVLLSSTINAKQPGVVSFVTEAQQRKHVLLHDTHHDSATLDICQTISEQLAPVMCKVVKREQSTLRFK